MTDLQLALLALGAIIILAVVIFNWWQERGIRKEAAERFVPPQRDVLMDDEFHMDTEAILQDEEAVPEATRSEIAYSVPSDDRFDDEQASNIDDDLAAYQAEHDNNSQATEQPTESKWRDTTPAEPQWVATEPLSFTQTAGLESVSAYQPNTEPEVDFASTQPIYPAHTTETNDSLPEGISHQIDLTAILYLPHVVTGEALRELLLSLTDLDKPFYAHGLSADDTWHMLTREQGGSEFKRAAYSLQLADRSGPISKESLNRFQFAVDSIGHKLGAQVEWRGNPDPLEYANELDQFCIDVDKMVGFHIIQGPSGPFTGTKFRGLAEASGLVLAEDGAFHYVNEHGQRMFSLINQDNNPFNVEMLRTVVLRGVSFQLDIPRVKHCAEVFNQMVLAAKQMEHSLNASLVDDHQRALGEIQIEKIRQQLKVIHSQMVARGVVPGSATALRLFS
ncbi:MAG: cell division protein ZipA C-terminal FtsZ-binding domain-containing protein [Methylophilaceae bacterium]